MPVLKLPSPLQSYVGNQRSILIDGSSIEEVIINLTNTYPQVKPQIFNPEGDIRSFISIFVHSTNIKDLKDGLKTKVREDDQIVILASMAGG